MSATFDPRRSQAVRSLLITQAAGVTRPRRRLFRAGALIVVGAVGGAALSTAAFAATNGFGADPATAIGTPSGAPTPAFVAAIDAPPGTIPGMPVTALVGEGDVMWLTEDSTYSLADSPSGATHVRVAITPQSPGRVAWGTDAQGNNPSALFGAADVSGGLSAWDDFVLDASTDAMYFTVGSGFTGIASIQYITQVPTHLGVNANGETYGVEGGPDGTPDLVAVWATAPDGTQLSAYARTSDLNAFSPDQPGQPSSPAQALEWQEERDRDYPNGWEIPAYESDGVTQVGTFP